MSTAARLQQVLRAMSSGRGFDRVLNKVLVVSGGEGRCVCEMKISEDHLNSYGTLHGGLTATLVDIVSTMALLTNETTSSGVSVNLAVSYMRGVKLGKEIIIDASSKKVGSSLAYLSVDITDKASGVLLAQGQHIKAMQKSR